MGLTRQCCAAGWTLDLSGGHLEMKLSKAQVTLATHTPPAPSFPCTSPATCVLDSAHERIRAAFSFRCPPSPPYIIHSVLLSPSTVPLHHLTLSTLSYCLHPVPLHHLTLSTLTVSIHCPPSPPYIIHCVLLSPSSPPSPPSIIHSYCLHPLPPFTTLIIHSYCRHPLPPFTTLIIHSVLLSPSSPPSPPYIIHSWAVLGPAVRASFALDFFPYTYLYFMSYFVTLSILRRQHCVR